MALKTAKLSALRKALLDARDLGKHRSMAELQVELGLSRRTLVRYLNDLRAQGDQVKSVRGKGWTMVKPRRDGTLESQIPEQLLVVLRKLGWALRGTPWHEEMEALFGAELKRVKTVAKHGMHGGAMAEAVRLNKVLFIADFAPGVRSEGAADEWIERDDDDDGLEAGSTSSLRRSLDEFSVRQSAWNAVAAAVWRDALMAARESKPMVVEYLNASKRQLDLQQVVLPPGHRAPTRRRLSARAQGRQPWGCRGRVGLGGGMERIASQATSASLAGDAAHHVGQGARWLVPRT